MNLFDATEVNAEIATCKSKVESLKQLIPTANNDEWKHCAFHVNNRLVRLAQLFLSHESAIKAVHSILLEVIRQFKSDRTDYNLNANDYPHHMAILQKGVMTIKSILQPQRLRIHQRLRV